MNALRKCPEIHNVTLYRGVSNIPEVRDNYVKNRVVTWFGFTSCTSNIEVLQNFSPSVIFQIEITTKRARNISAYSVYGQEDEVLLPCNSRFEVTGILSVQGGIYIIKLKELLPLDPILRYGMETIAGNLKHEFYIIPHLFIM